MSESAVLFLDANTLASPVTRTLMIAGALADGMRVVWSAHVEAEADQNARGTSSRISTVRADILGMELSPSATSAEALVTVSIEDRQVMADAVLAGTRYLITIDVDDFAFEDLAANEMSAVNPDYFMALRFTEHAYREGVGVLAEVAKNPPRTEEEVHRMLGRRHPHLTARFGDIYGSTAVPADRGSAERAVQRRRLLRYDSHLDNEEGHRLGLCTRHRGR